MLRFTPDQGEVTSRELVLRPYGEAAPSVNDAACKVNACRESHVEIEGET